MEETSVCGVYPRARPQAERAFFSVMALVMAGVVIAGFAPSLFLRPFTDRLPEFAAPEPFFVFHGVVFASWLALLVAQTSFVRQGHVRSHRILGMAGALLAVAMVVIGFQAALVAAGREGGFIGVPVPPQQFMIQPLTSIALFGALVAAGILLRGQPQSHKRLMILATVNLLGAALIRIVAQTSLPATPITEFLLVDLFILALAGWDLFSMRRIHSVTLWAGSASVISQPLRVWISGTQAWQDIAAWTLSLLGPD